ncbi:MAG: hypothetical protein RBR58_02900 [Candidatus Humimicrobiaceae bacterium]|nr:hypothetical protein [Actinomycetota bacterium]MDD5601174.1 hypothetical protein [Actinomycetota bacterium]MDY0027935.1 hypothetical protein [Candidatus Humimicrobiaceae bacterium]
MRNFLTVFSFINAILYAVIYSYFDNIIETLGVANLSPVVSNNIKLVALLITGFCAGMLVMLILKLKIKKSFFSFKNLVIVGIFPFICLILSEGTITSFIVTRFFHSSEKVSELLFYLFSRQAIWSLWLGFAIGSSIRFHFPRIRYRHISVENDGK